MKKRIFAVTISAVLFTVLGKPSALAANASFNVPAGSTNTTKQSLGNGQTGIVQSTGTLTSPSGTVITIAGTSTSAANQITVTNSGLISAGTGTGGGRDIRDQSGGSNTLVTNNAGGLILGAGNDAIAINAAGSAATSASVIDIENFGTIQTVDGGGTGSATTPTAAGNQAINLKATTGSNLVANHSTGVIWSTAADGVRPGLGGVVHNDGLIFSNAYQGSSSDGIDAQTNTGIIIINGFTTTTPGGSVATFQGPITGYVGNQSDVAGKTQSMIEGGRHGITGGNTGTGTTTPVYVDTLNPAAPGVYAMTVTNNQGAIIQGDNGSGINIDGFGFINASSQSVTNELVTITNAGSITGNGVTGDGDGVDVDGAVILHNSGSIISRNSTEFSEGVTVGGGTIVNGVGGTIEGKTSSGSTGVGRGITIAGVDKGADDSDIPLQSAYAYTDPSTGTLVSPNVTNSGLIKGDSESGIAVLGTTSGALTITLTNTATGTIEGNNTGVSERTVITTGAAAGQSNGQSLNEGAIELDDTSNTYVINNSGTIQQDGASGVAVAMHGVTNTLNVTGSTAKIAGDIDGGTGASTVNIGTGTDNTAFGYAGRISGNTTVNVKAGSTFMVGGTQATTTAVGNVTLETAQFTAGTGTNPTANLNVATANLTFALGDSDSSSRIVVTGGTNSAITFSSSTVSIDDLAGSGLDTAHEYVLIDGDGAHTTYTGLTFGATNSSGEQITGGLQLLFPGGDAFSQNYRGSQLYYDAANGDIDVVLAAPEPSTWSFLLIGAGAFAFLRLPRRQA